MGNSVNMLIEGFLEVEKMGRFIFNDVEMFKL